ncbi:unnamed protein product [Lymnaea stagnalis]|uniref:CUB domain-containing protein n=1 Tax=Lymnaea stagnalis TaxID=6523 RepID=A0AAV2GXH4_LYMST
MSIVALILCSASVALVAHATVCGVPPVSDLLPHDSICNRSSQCQTKSCKNNTCVCPLDYYFHNCSSRCIPSCNKTLTTSSTFIASPSYPNNYSNNVYCFWTIVGLSGDVLSFSILDYALGGCCDNISVYDGINKKAAFLGNISQVNQTIVATSSLMYIVFTTDGSGVDTGFYGSVRSHECTSVITEPTGLISSPVYPNGDFRNGNCRWSIQGASRDEYIVISFHDFDIGPCANGNVTLSEGNKQVAYFCGTVFPTSVRSTSYYISLEYKTGNQSQLAHRGFNATYRIYNPSKGVTEESIGPDTSYFTAPSRSSTETSTNKAGTGKVTIEMSTSPSAGTNEVLGNKSATTSGTVGRSTSKATKVTSTQSLKCTPSEYDMYRCIWKDDTQYNAGCHHSCFVTILIALCCLVLSTNNSFN